MEAWGKGRRHQTPPRASGPMNTLSLLGHPDCACARAADAPTYGVLCQHIINYMIHQKRHGHNTPYIIYRHPQKTLHTTLSYPNQPRPDQAFHLSLSVFLSTSFVSVIRPSANGSELSVPLNPKLIQVGILSWVPMFFVFSSPSTYRLRTG